MIDCSYEFDRPTMDRVCAYCELCAGGLGGAGMLESE